jgi:hypothetical protein
MLGTLGTQHVAWTERLVSRIMAEPSPTVIVGTRTHGVNHLIAELAASGQAVCWVEFDSLDAGDSASQGSKLAAALSESLGASLVGHGLPVEYTMQLAATICAQLPPMVFAFTNAHFALDALRSIRHLASRGARVIIC